MLQLQAISNAYIELIKGCFVQKLKRNFKLSLALVNLFSKSQI